MVSPFALRYLLLLLVSDIRYPLPDAGDIRQSPFGNRVTRPHLDGDPSGLIHHAKPGLVGQVIPNENRRPPLKAAAINAAMAAPLLIPRFYLHDAFARLQRQLWMCIATV
jgi:hypothetical protein